MKQRALLVLGALLAMLTLGVAPAHAATLVVDDDGQASVTDCNAASPASSSTIQAAIGMASAGDTIKVCPGTYAENVSVDKANLTIDGAKAGKDARTRSQTNESIVTGTDPTGAVQLKENGIEWDGFTVSGNTAGPGIYTSPSFSGHDVANNVIKDNVFGLYLHSTGVNQNLVRRNRFTSNNQPGAAAGNGIYSDQGVQRALITVNKFELNENAAIVFANAATTQNQLTIERNQSIDDTTFVALFNTSNTTVATNTIRNDLDDTGSAIFVGGDNDGVTVERNKITSAGFSGIAVRDTLGAAPKNVDIIGNSIQKAYNHGIDVTASGVGEVEVRSNSVRNSRRSGLLFGVDTKASLVLNNTSFGNGSLDCEDGSSASPTVVGTAGTANTWMDNRGRTDAPDGLCRP